MFLAEGMASAKAQGPRGESALFGDLQGQEGDEEGGPVEEEGRRPCQAETVF